MTRENMIEELTANELDWLVNNVDKHNMANAVEFFANGGFTAWTDEKLAKVYDDKLGEEK